jgi:hypothetical protein
LAPSWCGPTQSSEGSTGSLEGKPNAALETNSAPAEEANKAWLTERALGSSGDATGHVVLEGSGGSPPKSPVVHPRKPRAQDRPSDPVASTTGS